GFTYVINWGDGTPGNPDIQTIGPTPGNALQLVTHIFSQVSGPGGYTITATATGEDGVTSNLESITTTIAIVALEDNGTELHFGAQIGPQYTRTDGTTGYMGSTFVLEDDSNPTFFSLNLDGTTYHSQDYSSSRLTAVMWGQIGDDTFDASQFSGANVMH